MKEITAPREFFVPSFLHFFWVLEIGASLPLHVVKQGRHTGRTKSFTVTRPLLLSFVKASLLIPSLLPNLTLKKDNN